MRGGQAARTFFPRWCAPARGGSVGEITTRRQTQPILCIVVEFVRVEVAIMGLTTRWACGPIWPTKLVGFTMSADLENPIFTDEDAAREHLERVRWPNGPVCPRCGGKDRVAKMEGEAYRPGLYRCGKCRRQFTATIGTVYERSHIPLHKWFLAMHLMAASKKGVSAHQLHRMLGLSYKSAWFLAHRIREAMNGTADDPGGLGGP